MRALPTKSVALIGVFAALHTVLFLMPTPFWRNWAIYFEPIEGIILGPWAGFASALIGSVVARMIKPISEWMFGVIAEPVGVMVSGLLARRRWKLVVGMYAIMLTAYFLHPFGRRLPLWTILDILLALIMVYPITRFGGDIFEEKAGYLPLYLCSISFIGTAADSLTRIFLLIPVGWYALFFSSFETVYVIFVGGAVTSYVEDIMIVIFSLLVGTPLLLALRRIPGFRYPLS